MCESGDERFFAIAEVFGDANIAIWIFPEDAHVVLCYQEWISRGQRMPCCIDFWARRLLPDDAITFCKEGNVCVIEVCASVDVL